MKLQWNTSLSVWWSFIWRSVCYGAVGGFVLGAVGGAIAGATGHLDQARVVGSFAGYVAGLALSTVAMKQALQKHLAELAGEAVQPAEEKHVNV